MLAYVFLTDQTWIVNWQIKAPKFKNGDYRRNVEAFNSQEIIDRLLENKVALEKKFSKHSQPVMHGLIAPLLDDAPTGCVLLGQRNEDQVVKASQLGEVYQGKMQNG